LAAWLSLTPVVAAVGVGGVGSAAVVRAAGPAPTFGNATIAGVTGIGDEEGMRVDGQGNIYVTSIDSLSSGTSWIWKSKDGGNTFKWIRAAAQPSGKLTTCVGGGDSEMATDSANHLYFNELTLANFSTSRSDNGGDSFTSSCSGVLTPINDREWYAVDGDPTLGTGSIFLVYDLVGGAVGSCSNVANAPNQLVMARSPIPGGNALAGVQFGPSKLVGAACNEGIMGNDEFFDYGGNGGKKVFVVHDNDALNGVLMGRCDVLAFGAPTLSSDPSGLGNCVDVTISSFPGSKTGANFPTMAVDRVGNLYAVWEQAPLTGTNVSGDVVLMFSKSTNQGNTWTAPTNITPAGLRTNVFAWTAAGDNGMLDIAWYGTTTAPGTNGADNIAATATWNTLLIQSLDAGATWSAPAVIGEHFTKRGTIQTLIGGQTGNRDLGDFFQMRIGPQGEAQVSYMDANNRTDFPTAMFARQNGGTSVYAANPVVNGNPLRFNSVTDVPGDATFDNAGSSSASIDNLDILASSMTKPNATTYEVKMTVKNMSLTVPVNAGGPDMAWLTQWLVPSNTDARGGKVFYAYMESFNGGPPTCMSGQEGFTLNGGGVLRTYPGDTAITGPACSFTPGPNGVITIDVPTANVTEAGAIGTTLYSVTASTLTAANRLNTAAVSSVGGIPPSLIDVAPAYDFEPTFVPIPEVPFAALLILAGAPVAMAAWARRRRRATA
jgi:hypothetical protein